MSRAIVVRCILAVLCCASSLTADAQKTYAYDGSGNITTAGDETFVYDKFGRIRKATIAGIEQTFTYDRHGNITSIATEGESGGEIEVGADNKLSRATYDGSGNLVSYHGGTFAYDGLNVVKESRPAGGNRHLYIYTASNERLATIELLPNGQQRSEWTLRDPEGRVLRRLVRDTSGAWSWNEDYIYRGSQLLAAEVPTPEKVRHFHLDHLGTPRLITGNGGATIAERAYGAFGRGFAVSPSSVHEQLEFTGHERDNFQLDYMHARYYDPMLGRFLSADPGRDWDLDHPQSWNAYSYVRNNPVNRTDPTGRYVESGIEVVSIGIGGYSLYQNLKAGNYGSAAIDTAGLALDIAALVVPVVPGGAGAGIKAIRAANATDNVVDTGRTSRVVTDTARGRASEGRVLESMGLKKNTETVTTSSGSSIPDAQDATRVVEIKDTQRACNTCQMRVQREHAQATGREHVVVTGTNTKVSSRSKRTAR